MNRGAAILSKGWWKARFRVSARLLQLTMFVAPEGKYKDDFIDAVGALTAQPTLPAGVFAAYENRMHPMDNAGPDDNGEEVLGIWAPHLVPRPLPQHKWTSETPILLHRDSGEVVRCRLRDEFRDDESGDMVYIFAGADHEGEDVNVLVNQPALN